MRICCAALRLAWILFCFGSCSLYHPKPLDTNEIEAQLQPPDIQTIFIDADQISHPALKPVLMDPSNGLTPDQAALIAVLVNPTLKAERDKRGVALAQVFQAQILPNPVFTFTRDYPYFSPTPGAVNAFFYGFAWNPVSLLTLGPQTEAAEKQAASVELSIAWMEWQAAEKAKQQIYRVALLERQLATAKEGEKGLLENRSAIKQAVAQGNKTVLDLSAVEASLETVHLSVLSIEQKLEIEKQALNEALGYPPYTAFEIHQNIQIPLHLSLGYSGLIADLEKRRFDLLALKMGYESQEPT